MWKNLVKPRTRGRVVAATMLAAGAIAAGVLGSATPAANAQPIGERTIKSECASAGGYYQTWADGGSKYSMCTYTDIDGVVYHDVYINGVYTKTV
jgi:hypothetical protein